jgi:hypothetical protein
MRSADRAAGQDGPLTSQAVPDPSTTLDGSTPDPNDRVEHCLPPKPATCEDAVKQDRSQEEEAA